MKICTATALLIAFTAIVAPFASAQSSAPSAAAPIESLVPSSALPIESSVPSSIETSAAPTAAEPTETIAELVVSDPRFSRLENLLVSTGLLPSLEGDGPLTLFAPTNEAFTAFGISGGASAASLINIASYHAVVGEQVVLEDGLAVTTLQGDDVVLTVTEEVTKVNGANIEGSALATNGIVYVIDAVLRPSAPSPTPGASTPAPTPVEEDSSAPSSTVAVESLVPTVAEGNESLTPTETEDTTEDTAAPIVPAPTPGAATAEPTPADESSAPSAAIPVESLVPTGAEGIESLTPTETEDTTEEDTVAPTVPAPTPGAATLEPIVTADSSAPSASIPVESLVPTSAEGIEPLTPTETADTAQPTVPAPTPGAATAPTQAVDSSSAPSVSEIVESVVPTTPFVPAIDPKCSAHSECLMVGMDGDCCPTIENVFLDCCDMGDVDPTTATPEDATTATPEDTTIGVTADPLDIDEDFDSDSTVTLTPTEAFGCMKINGNGNDDDELYLATCNASDPKQQFKFVGSQVQLAMDTSKCLQAGRRNTPSQGKYMRVYPCDATNDLQDFTWDRPEGRLYPTQYSDVTVVYQGTTAHVNRDRIIVANIDTADVVARQGWKILS